MSYFLPKARASWMIPFIGVLLAGTVIFTVAMRLSEIKLHDAQILLFLIANYILSCGVAGSLDRIIRKGDI